jgi:hypothetical protein
MKKLWILIRLSVNLKKKRRRRKKLASIEVEPSELFCG